MYNFVIIQEVSYSCPAKCPYCMNIGLDYSEKIDISKIKDFYKRILNEGKIYLIKITGGEPLAPQNIEITKELVNFLSEEPKVEIINVNTNGYYPILEEWKDIKKLRLQISFDGDKEYMTKCTKLPNIYDNLINNFKRCRELGIPFYLKSVITNENIEYLEFITDFANTNEYDCTIQFSMPVGGAYTNNSQELLDKMILREEIYNKYKSPFIRIKPIIKICEAEQYTDYCHMVITPSGNINRCAFMATQTESRFNIDDFNVEKFNSDMNQQMKGRSCYFPDGYFNFYNSLTDEEKEIVDNLDI